MFPELLYYIAPIGDIIRRHNLSFHLFADDTQLVTNLLKVNDDKAAAPVLASRNDRAKHNITVIKIGDCDITPSRTPSYSSVAFVYKQ